MLNMVQKSYFGSAEQLVLSDFKFGNSHIGSNQKIFLFFFCM